MNHTSFRANNTLMEALQQVEEQAEEQMLAHTANTVSSQQSVDEKLEDLIRKMNDFKQEVANIKANKNQGQQHQHDIFNIPSNYC